MSNSGGQCLAVEFLERSVYLLGVNPSVIDPMAKIQRPLMADWSPRCFTNGSKSRSL